MAPEGWFYAQGPSINWVPWLKCTMLYPGMGHQAAYRVKAPGTRLGDPWSRSRNNTSAPWEWKSEDFIGERLVFHKNNSPQSTPGLQQSYSRMMPIETDQSCLWYDGSWSPVQAVKPGGSA